MSARSHHILVFVTVFAVVVLGAIAVYLVRSTPGRVLTAEAAGQSPPPPSASPTTVTYTVADGTSAEKVAEDLAALGVVDSQKQFEYFVSLTGVSGRLSAGEHELRLGSSVITAVDAVTVKDSVPVLRVTFPEGMRYEEMAERASVSGFGTGADFVSAVDNAVVPPLLAAAIPEGHGLQGYLFPDTYILPSSATTDQLVDLMLSTFLGRVTPAMLAAYEERGLTLHEAVTLASIIEREAVLDEERPVIAGVFYNRLAAGDLLGADPTVQFAAALDPASVAEYGWWKAELTVEDLANPSPYNTRLNAGIPPGPIANPGLASLEAVAFPTETDYYYFVADAKADDGSHRFAVTFEEHEANIAEYGTP